MRRLSAIFFIFALTLQLAHAKQSPASLDSYLQDLEELGYCVIPGIISDAETQQLYERVWHDFIEKVWPNCKMDDRSNWRDTFPKHNMVSIFAGPAGQTQVMWDLRQDPRIVHVFSRIWNTSDLIVSMDGLSFMCPPEIREGNIQSWPHVDQLTLQPQDNRSALKTNPYTIQGQFLFEDSFDGDGGLYCIPKSHLRFTEFVPHLKSIHQVTDSIERSRMRTAFLEDFFHNHLDESGNLYLKKHISAPRGSLILWDSRTVHWNQHASDTRPRRDNPKVRMVGYLCYVPKARLTEEGYLRRKEAFERGVSTGHDPVLSNAKYTKDHIYKEFLHYLEDPSYDPPKIHLTPLGKSLLGIEDASP